MEAVASMYPRHSEKLDSTNHGLIAYALLGGVIACILSCIAVYSVPDLALWLPIGLKHSIIEAWPPNMWHEAPSCKGMTKDVQYENFQIANGLASIGLCIITASKFISDSYLISECGHEFPIMSLVVLCLTVLLFAWVASRGLLCERTLIVATINKTLIVNILINLYWMLAAHLSLWVISMLFWRKIKFIFRRTK